MSVSVREILSTMPVISSDVWSELSLAKRWLSASRAAVFFLTVFSVLTAGLLALLRDQFDLLGWLLCLIGLTFAHATNNLINDYVDFRSGLDQGNYFRVRYGTHVLNDRLMTEQELRGFITFSGLVAFVFGVMAIAYGGLGVLVPFSMGAFLLLFYTWPLKHWALGEIAVFLVWGPLMSAGTYQVMTGVWNWQIALVGCLIGLPQTLVILGKHIDKIAFDQSRSVLTLPVVLGLQWSTRLVMGLLGLIYLVLGAMIWGGLLPILALLAYVSVGRFLKLLRVYSRPVPSNPPEDYPPDLWPLWFTVHSFLFFRSFAFWLTVGLALSLVMPFWR